MSRFIAANPEFVRTDPTGRWSYGVWLLEHNWEFYREVLTKYDVVASDQKATFWQRRNSQTVTPSAWSELIAKNANRVNGVALPQKRGTAMYELEVTYKVHHPVQGLPIIGGMPRYLLRVSSPEGAAPSWTPQLISLPDKGYSHTRVVPILVPGSATSGEVGLFAERYALWEGTFTITRLRIRELPVNLSTIRALLPPGVQP